MRTVLAAILIAIGVALGVALDRCSRGTTEPARLRRQVNAQADTIVKYRAQIVGLLDSVHDLQLLVDGMEQERDSLSNELRQPNKKR